MEDETEGGGTITAIITTTSINTFINNSHNSHRDNSKNSNSQHLIAGEIFCPINSSLLPPKNESHNQIFKGNYTFSSYYQHSSPVAAMFIIAYLFIFFMCMIGNMLVCFIVLKNRQMRTVTNIFILNLAISDVLVGIFCMPTTLVDNLITGWPFDIVMCKMSGLVQGMSVSASVFTLVAIAVERCSASSHILLSVVLSYSMPVSGQRCHFHLGILSAVLIGFLKSVPNSNCLESSLIQYACR